MSRTAVTSGRPYLISASSPTASIEATIMDHSGADISSSFEIRFFRESDLPTNSSLNNRGGAFVRDMTKCRNQVDTYLNSQCESEDGKTGSLQAYAVNCRHWGHSRGGWRSVTRGHCEEDEICIEDTTPPGIGVPPGRAKMATCVAQRAFTKGNKDGGQWGTLAKSFQNTYLSMTASKLDLATSMEVDMFSVEASMWGNVDVSDADHGSTYRCHDCMTLGTDKFAEGTDLLKTQTRVLATGAAIHGVLWIALLSG